MTVTASAPSVLPGQVWADVDPRRRGRTIRVEEITGDKSLCMILTNTDQLQALVDAGAPNRPDMRGRRTRVRLDRLRPTRTGYRLVRDAEQ